MAQVFGDLENDDVFDPSAFEPRAVGLLFTAILVKVIADRPKLTRKEMLALALILLVERLGREGSV